MTHWPHLTRSPIVEGLIDLRVSRSSSVSIAEIRGASDELAAEFPSRVELRHFAGQIDLSPQSVPQLSAAVDEPGGVLLRSVDEKWAVQFRLDGFTVSRLQPYGDWDELKAKAALLWARYAEVTKPHAVTRIATRFLNRIPLVAGEPFENTFLTTFSVGPSLPQTLVGYLLRTIIPFDEDAAIAILTQSVEGGSTDCILDIDVFMEHAQGFAVSDVWAKLEQLRHVKNRLFFGSLTEGALERFI